MATHAVAGGPLWFAAVWAMLHTRARGTDCLSIRPWEEEGGELLGRRRWRWRRGRLRVGARALFRRSVLPAAAVAKPVRVRRRRCLLLLPASDGVPSWICISLSSEASYT